MVCPAEKDCLENTKAFFKRERGRSFFERKCWTKKVGASRGEKYHDRKENLSAIGLKKEGRSSSVTDRRGESQKRKEREVSKGKTEKTRELPAEKSAPEKSSY